MAKMIRYKYLSAEINHGTDEQPGMEQIFLDVSIECKTQAAYDANYPIAEKEAVPGTIEVTGAFDAEQEAEPTDKERIADLEEALELLLSGVTE